MPNEAEFDYLLADVWCDFTIATIDKPLTSIALSESEATIGLSSTKQLTATATPSDATIADIFEWSSSNPEVAVVDGNGLVSAVGEGTTVITAKAFDGSEVTGTCNITVRSFNATSITLNHSELNMFEKEYTTLTYTILPEDATVKTAEWSVSDSNVLTYREMDDGSLKIVAKSAGTATITARTTDGSNLEATCIIKVLESNDEALAALNALVANAETLYNNSVEGDNIGDYTPGARAELFASIESVKSKISESMSADEITACTNEINAAIQLFESKKVTTTKDTNVSLYENIIFVENAEAFVGKSVTLSLKMNNTIVPVGFQCDFYAPSKTSVPTDEDGFYAIDLSTERTTASRHNIFESGLQKDGGIRILAASTRNYPFAGNEGEVITITLNVDADLEEGEYPLILRNVIISDAQSNTYSVDYVKSTLTVSNYTPGDVNGDGSINIGDVTAVVSYIMGAETNVFIKEAAWILPGRS